MNVGEFLGIVFGSAFTNELIEFAPVVHLNAVAVRLVFAYHQFLSIVEPTFTCNLNFLQFFLGLFQLRQWLFALEVLWVGISGDIVGHFDENGYASVIFWLHWLLLAKNHLPVCAFFRCRKGGTVIGKSNFSEFLFRFGDYILAWGCQFLKTELPTTLLLLQSIFIVLLQVIILLLAPTEDAEWRSPRFDRASDEVVAGQFRNPFLFLLSSLLVVLDEAEFVLEAKFALEELYIFYIFEFFRFSWRIPDPSGLFLHESDIFLAFLYLQTIKKGTFALDYAAIDQLTNNVAADVSGGEVNGILLHFLAVDQQIEL